MKPLVSIIVPVYNVEKYINACITSIIDQTYKNLQIILIDDGTPDNSGVICDECAKKDERISVIHKENGGLSSARNAGIDTAKGDYIMFVDGDDYLVDNAVEILLSANEKYDADFVQFELIHTECEDYIKNSVNEKYNVQIITDLDKMYWKMYETVGSGESACTKLYKRHLFDGLRFKEGIIHEDAYFAIFMLQKVKKAVYLDIGLYNYIIRENSIITSPFSKKNLDSICVFEGRIKEFNRLGFVELEEYAKEKYFFHLTNLWCSAKHVKNKECLKIIDEKIKVFQKNEKSSFTGKTKVLYNMCKANVGLLYFYYLYKKITRQI